MMKPKIYCPYCNAELRLGDKFCGKCGKKIEWSDEDRAESSTPGVGAPVEQADSTCPSCGTTNKPGSAQCKVCGYDLRQQSAGREAIPSSVKQGKKEQAGSKGGGKGSSLLNSWKLAVALVAIVAAAVLIDYYVSRENIPQQAAQQQQVAVPQQPTGANMAALPQIEAMEKQVKANPDNLDATIQLANFLSDNRFYDKAITYYQAYLTKKPRDANARVDMGICYKEVGKYSTAIQEMKKALEYEPKHLFATFNLGIVTLDEAKQYMDEGQMDKANALVSESSDWFRKTVALAPTSEVGKRAQQLLTQHSNTQLPSTN